jgi:hypothetical protein
MSVVSRRQRDVLKALPSIRDRIYGDFLMGSRLDLYGKLLETALQTGYRISPVGEAWRLMQDGELDPSQRRMILRHDIDTDPRTAAAMWSIDRALGVKSSYFFRLATFAPALMADIAGDGGEASYHFEELSSIAKQQHLRSGSAALRHLPEARDRFAENLQWLRGETGLPMRVVASHGDFVNRRLGVPNWVILTDLEFRRRVGIVLETYDEAFLRRLPARYTDASHPQYWDPGDPAAMIRAGEPVISVLVHPRHWRVDRLVNARDDIRRAVDGMRFALPSGPRGRE